MLRDVRVTGILTRQHAPVAGASLAFQPQKQIMTVTTMTSGSPIASPVTGPLRNKAITGPDGRFELLLDDAGRHFVEVSFADGRATHFRNVEIPDTDAYELEIDISGAAVSGLVLEKGTERPLSSVRLAFVPVKDRSSGFVHCETGADGRFQVDLEPGSYGVNATLAEYVTAIVELEVPTADETRILLSRGRSLEGKVVDDAGRGVVGLAVSAFPADGGSGIRARSLSDGSFRLGGTRRAAARDPRRRGQIRPLRHCRGRAAGRQGPRARPEAGGSPARAAGRLRHEAGRRRTRRRLADRRHGDRVRLCGEQ